MGTSLSQEVHVWDERGASRLEKEFGLLQFQHDKSFAAALSDVPVWSM